MKRSQKISSRLDFSHERIELFFMSAHSTTAFQQQISLAIEPSREALLSHRLYQKLHHLSDLSTFMEYHVYAVWDFMSLLKALQYRLTCVTIPWIPAKHGILSRLVNEIVLGEESDELPGGGAASHYELYLESMKEVGASTISITHLLEKIASGCQIEQALESVSADQAVRDFVKHTFAVIHGGKSHEIAAAFTFGREDLIPEMFTQLVHSLEREFPGRLETLRYYLDRHIALDGDEHGEMGRQMVALLCGDCQQKQQEALAAAVASLEARLALWDAIADRLA